MIFDVPRICPVCKEQLWSDEQLMDPQFYRQQHASQYYRKHMSAKHPDFAIWDSRIQRYIAIALIFDAVSFILFIGAHLSSVAMLIIALWLVSSLTISFVLGWIRLRGRRTFQGSWKQAHPRGL